MTLRLLYHLSKNIANKKNLQEKEKQLKKELNNNELNNKEQQTRFYNNNKYTKLI